MSLVLDNAVQYNIAPGNIYRKLALRIQKAAAPVCASLIEQVRQLGAFPTTAAPEDMQLEASEASIRALKEPSGQDQITLLETLFSYELEPPRPPTPPPKPKYRADKDEARARKQAKAAKFDEPRIPGRSTRHTVAMGIDSLVHTDEPPVPVIDEPEDGSRRKSRRQAANAVGETRSNTKGPRVRRSHTSEVGVDDNRVPSRGRQRSKVDGKANGVTDSASGELTSASSGEVVPLDRAERGVVGKETYSPLGPKERREHDKRMAMELVVDNLDSRADFKRFNVGWVLPEGTKRGGRRERMPDPGLPKKRKCKHHPHLRRRVDLSSFCLFTASKVTDTSASSAVDARSTAETDWRTSVDVNGHLSPSAPPQNMSNQKPTSPTPSRQPSPATSDSSLSSLSELSDVPDGEEEPQADEPKEEGQAGPASRTDVNVSSASPVTGTRIRKRTYDSDSDYLLPEHYKRPRLQSTLSKDKQGGPKTAVQKMSTPTDSDLSTLSPAGDRSKGGKPQSSKDTTELDEDEEMDDDAEPDEDEERDERLASLRGTNGSTAVGKWQDPYPDGTLGKFDGCGLWLPILILHFNPQFGLNVSMICFAFGAGRLQSALQSKVSRIILPRL
jgi:NuA3 HAT complex component NTO1